MNPLKNKYNDLVILNAVILADLNKLFFEYMNNFSKIANL